MSKFMIFSLTLTVAAANLEGYNYKPDYSDFAENPPDLPTAIETEYFSYSAPENFHDSKDVNRLAAILRPQRVVFIKNPENNILSITAEQLAKQQALSIYVLNRQTNTADLLSQLEEIRQQNVAKPNVQFVKYRTADDIARAKQAIFNNFDSIPGPLKYQEDAETPVYNFDANSHNFYSARRDKVTTHPPPVIFEIIKLSTPAPIVQAQNDATYSTEVEGYLPPKLN